MSRPASYPITRSAVRFVSRSVSRPALFSRLLRRGAVLPAALALLLPLAQSSHAQTYITHDTNITGDLSDLVIIGYANANDYGSGTNGVNVNVRVSGGATLSDSVVVNTHSVFTLNDATLGSMLFGYENSVLNLSGGSVNDSLLAHDNSTVNLTGSETNGVFSYDNSRLTISGSALVDSDVDAEGSAFNLSGGSISGSVSVYNGTAAITGGSVLGDGVGIYDNVQATMSGGDIAGSLDVGDNAVLDFSGGSVGGDLDAFGSGTINVRGGMFGDLVAYDSGTLNLFGTGLGLTYLGDAFNYSQYALRGTLADGTKLDGLLLYTQDAGSPTINLVTVTPEPGSVALLVGVSLTGANFLVRRRRRK